MGRLGQNFKRFPHRCTIYSMGTPTGFETEEELANLKHVIWEGVCRKERMSNGTGEDNVRLADYRINLGEVVNGKEVGAIVTGLHAGLDIEVTDLQGTFILDVKDVYAGQLGTSVFADTREGGYLGNNSGSSE